MTVHVSNKRIFLHYTGTPPSNESPLGLYPTVINQSGGKKALVVQDFTWGKYLGYLNVTFDSNGEVTSYNGNPILLDSTVEEGIYNINVDLKLYLECSQHFVSCFQCRF